MNLNLQELLSRFDDGNQTGEKLKLQHVLIGSPEAIRAVTHTLWALNYAEVGLWSPIVPMPGTNLSMSVLTRYRRS
jgi:hypothetical protein